MDYNIDTPETELIEECRRLIYSPHQTVHELQLDYILGLLYLKQQEKLNQQLVKTNFWLVIATWVLAAATIFLVLVSNRGS